MEETILFIEHDTNYRTEVRNQLDQLGYHLLPVYSFSELGDDPNLNSDWDEHSVPGVILMSAEHFPDPSDSSGFLNLFGRKYGCPIILYGSESTLKEATPHFNGYNCTVLVKTLRMPELSINLDLALDGKLKAKPLQQQENAFTTGVMQNSIFIPQDAMHHRVVKEDILYAEADGSYTQIVTDQKQYQISLNLKNFIEQLHDPHFLRVSRKHLINANRVSRIEGNTIILDEEDSVKIPLSQSKKKEILSRFKIFKTK